MPPTPYTQTGTYLPSALPVEAVWPTDAWEKEDEWLELGLWTRMPGFSWLW